MDGGLFRSFSNALTSSDGNVADGEEKPDVRPVGKKTKGKPRAANASAVAIAEVKASGKGHGTLAQFIRAAKK